MDFLFDVASLITCEHMHNVWSLCPNINISFQKICSIKTNKHNCMFVVVADRHNKLPYFFSFIFLNFKRDYNSSIMKCVQFIFYFNWNVIYMCSKKIIFGIIV